METIHHRKVIEKGSNCILLAPRCERLTGKLQLEIPGLLYRLSFLMGNPTPCLRKEVSKAKELVSDTKVRIPKTKIFRTKYDLLGPGFVIGREIIEGDNSIPDISAYLKEKKDGEKEKSKNLMELYLKNPDHFSSQDGYLYWLKDPLQSKKNRFIGSSKTVALKTCRVIAKPFRLVGF